VRVLSKVEKIRERILNNVKNSPANTVLNQLGKEEWLLTKITDFSIPQKVRIIIPICRIVPNL